MRWTIWGHLEFRMHRIQEDGMQEQKYIQSPVSLCSEWRPTHVFSQAPKRRTETYTVDCSNIYCPNTQLETWLAVQAEKPNAWLCCVCSAKRDSCYGCESQRLSSRMSCDCSSCRRSNCGSGSGSGSGSCSCSCPCSDSGWCCELGSDCGYVWRCCSTMTRWSTDCWRKDWVGSKGWVASWHCREQWLNAINLKAAYSFYPRGFVLVIRDLQMQRTTFLCGWIQTGEKQIYCFCLFNLQR